MKRALGFMALAALLALPAAAGDAPKTDTKPDTKKEDAAIQQIDDQIAKAKVDKASPS